MKALVAYESSSGHTLQAAEAIADAVRALQGEVSVRPVTDVRPVDVQLADVLFIGTWVQGRFIFSAKPAGAREWVPRLPPLMNKPVGVFCTYLLSPRGALHMLSALLEDRGGKIKREHAFQQGRPGAGAEGFVRDVLDSAGLIVP